MKSKKQRNWAIRSSHQAANTTLKPASTMKQRTNAYPVWFQGRRKPHFSKKCPWPTPKALFYPPGGALELPPRPQSCPFACLAWQILRFIQPILHFFYCCRSQNHAFYARFSIIVWHRMYGDTVAIYCMLIPTAYMLQTSFFENVPRTRITSTFWPC